MDMHEARALHHSESPKIKLSQNFRTIALQGATLAGFGAEPHTIFPNSKDQSVLFHTPNHLPRATKNPIPHIAAIAQNAPAPNCSNSGPEARVIAAPVAPIATVP